LWYSNSPFFVVIGNNNSNNNSENVNDSVKAGFLTTERIIVSERVWGRRGRGEVGNEATMTSTIPPPLPHPCCR
jgi:hypothetical protein